jgi:folate-binding protein YgfZ
MHRRARQVEAMVVSRLERALIRVAGPDRISFLDNLLTQRVEGLEGVRYGALLTPQGKVIADTLIWSHGEVVILETDPKFADALLSKLSMYRLRANITLGAAADLAVAFSVDPFEGALADPRMPNGELGWRKLIASADAAALPEGDETLWSRRFGCSVPDLAVDIQPDEIFAGEALLEELNGVDFQKGCFVGQENVSRMKRRATTRRKLCSVAFSGARFEYGTPIRAGAAEIGAIRSAQRCKAIALIRLDRALEAQERGQKLMAGEIEIHLDPPDWLILPPGAAQAPAGDD